MLTPSRRIAYYASARVRSRLLRNEARLVCEHGREYLILLREPPEVEQRRHIDSGPPAPGQTDILRFAHVAGDKHLWAAARVRVEAFA